MSKERPIPDRNARNLGPCGVRCMLMQAVRTWAAQGDVEAATTSGRTTLLGTSSLALLLAALLNPFSYGQCRYEITAVIEGPECAFGRAGIFAEGLNDSGTVVGTWLCAGGSPVAFTWTIGAPVPIPMPKGTRESQAFDVELVGCVLGNLDISGDEFGNLSFIFDGTTTILLPMLPQSDRSEPTAINRNKQVVGGWFGDGESHAFHVEDDTVTNLGPLLGTPRGAATDINDAGQIVGWMGTSPLTDGRAFVLDWDTGHVTDIGVFPGGVTGRAEAINARGEVVGSGVIELPNAARELRSFYWSPNGRITDLGLLPGKTRCRVHDLNRFGQAVGSSSESGEDLAAFLWQGGSLFDLNDLMLPGPVDLRLWIGTASNNFGQILVVANDQGNLVGVVMTPTGVPVGDLDIDCRVTFRDLLELLVSWGACGECLADLNDDGEVDINDLFLLLDNWG